MALQQGQRSVRRRVVLQLHVQQLQQGLWPEGLQGKTAACLTWGSSGQQPRSVADAVCACPAACTQQDSTAVAQAGSLSFFGVTHTRSRCSCRTLCCVPAQALAAEAAARDTSQVCRAARPLSAALMESLMGDLMAGLVAVALDRPADPCQVCAYYRRHVGGHVCAVGNLNQAVVKQRGTMRKHGRQFFGT